jgi:uncharacterized protein involved in type VI secretion and phage assembly
MANEFLSGLLGISTEREGYAIAPGKVTNNLDAIAEGRVQVRIPSLPAYEPWARLSIVGGGSGRGFLWVPQIGDEVLVAFNQNDERDAYILGGLWNTLDRPPISDPSEVLTKRIIQTGLKLLPTDEIGPSHEIVLDDATQSITITSSTKQKVTIDPGKIELTNLAGSVKISMDNVSQSISIQAVNKIELKATTINIQGLKETNIQGPQVNIRGAMVNIN